MWTEETGLGTESNSPRHGECSYLYECTICIKKEAQTHGKVTTTQITVTCEQKSKSSPHTKIK